MFAGISIIRLLCKTHSVGGSIKNNQIKLSWYLAFVPEVQLVLNQYRYLTAYVLKIKLFHGHVLLGWEVDWDAITGSISGSNIGAASLRLDRRTREHLSMARLTPHVQTLCFPGPPSRHAS